MEHNKSDTKYGRVKIDTPKSFTVYALRFKNRGFTIFIAAVLSSLLLSIGLSVINFSTKQLIISSTSRESKFAFFSAVSGKECAIHWDWKFGDEDGSAFATSSDSTTWGLIPTSGITCGGRDIAAIPWSIDAPLGLGRATTTFSFNFAPQPYCVVVSVGKVIVSNEINTTIESRGYNIGTLSGASCTSSDIKRVERLVRVTY